MTETGLQRHELEKAPEYEDVIYSIYGHTLEQGGHLMESSMTCQGRMSWSRFAKPEQREACFEGDHLIKLASCFLPSSSTVKLKTLLSTQVRQGSLSPFISSSAQHTTLIKTPFPTSHHESPSAGVSAWVAEWRHFPQNSSNTYSVVFCLFDCFLRLQLKITHLNDCFFFFQPSHLLT